MKVTAFFCYSVESVDFIKRRVKKYRIVRERLLVESVDTAIHLFFFLFLFFFYIPISSLTIYVLCTFHETHLPYLSNYYLLRS